MKVNKKIQQLLWSVVCWVLYFPVALADAQSGPIPLSQAIINEANNDGVDGAWLYILQHIAIPIIEIICSSVILFAAVSSILSGVDEAKAERNWAPLKQKLLIAVLVIIFGGVCVYLLDQVRTYTFS